MPHTVTPSALSDTGLISLLIIARYFLFSPNRINSATSSASQVRYFLRPKSSVAPGS